MQKNNVPNDGKRKAFFGSVGLVGFIVFVFSSRLIPAPDTLAQVTPITVQSLPLADEAADAEKQSLKEENRIKDSINLSIAKKVSRVAGEVKAITAAKKKNRPAIPLTNTEIIYFRQDGEIVLSKPIVREGPFLIVDLNNVNGDIARLEAVSDTANVVTEQKVLPPKTKERERTGLSKLIYKITHPFKNNKQ
ncbi:MAG: hypothetical protein WC756_17635 [Taibaiella sp.]